MCAGGVACPAHRGQSAVRRRAVRPTRDESPRLRGPRGGSGAFAVIIGCADSRRVARGDLRSGDRRPVRRPGRGERHQRLPARSQRGASNLRSASWGPDLSSFSATASVARSRLRSRTSTPMTPFPGLIGELIDPHQASGPKKPVSGYTGDKLDNVIKANVRQGVEPLDSRPDPVQVSQGRGTESRRGCLLTSVGARRNRRVRSRRIGISHTPIAM